MTRKRSFEDITHASLGGRSCSFNEEGNPRCTPSPSPPLSHCDGIAGQELPTPQGVGAGGHAEASSGLVCQPSPAGVSPSSLSLKVGKRKPLSFEAKKRLQWIFLRIPDSNLTHELLEAEVDEQKRRKRVKRFGESGAEANPASEPDAGSRSSEKRTPSSTLPDSAGAENLLSTSDAFAVVRPPQPGAGL